MSGSTRDRESQDKEVKRSAAYTKSAKWYSFYRDVVVLKKIKTSKDFWNALPDVGEDEVDAAISCFQAIGSTLLADRYCWGYVYTERPDAKSTSETIRLFDNLFTKYVTNPKTPGAFIKRLTSKFPTLAVDSFMALEGQVTYYSQNAPNISDPANKQKLEACKKAQMTLLLNLDKAVFTKRPITAYLSAPQLDSYSYDHVRNY